MRHCKRQQGISLIEVMVTLFIIMAGFLSLGSLQAALTKSGDDARQRAHAVIGAEQRMEQYRYSQYDSIVTSSGSVPNTSYTLSWTVAADSSGKVTYKTITMTTTWQDRYGVNNTISTVESIDKLDGYGIGQMLKTPQPGTLAPS